MLSRVSITTQRSLHVFVAGVIALTLVVCALAGYNLWRLRQVAIENQLGDAAQHAGSFEEHLTQTLSVVDIALTNLGGHDAIEAALPALLRNARYLRSISQLDVAGRVVASSEPRNVNQQFDRSELLPVASGPLALLRIGPLTAGRDLYDAQRIKNGAGVPPQSFIAVQRDVLRPDGSYATMVAVINPDYFLNYYGRNLDTGVADMELYRLDGGLLLSTAQVFSPGSKSNALAMEKLAKTESGRFQEDLLSVPSRLVGYRVSRHFPVVVVVQFDASKALAAWRREATATLTVLLVVWVTIVAMLLLYFRRWQRFAEERQTWVRTLTEESAERKRTEVELLRFKNVLDNTLDMIFMFEPKSLHFVYVNQGALLSTGYSREELLGMTPYQIQPLIPEPKFRQLIAPLLCGEQPSLRFETVHRRKDDTDCPVAIFLQLVTQSDGSGLFVAIMRDISESKRAQDEIQRVGDLLRGSIANLNREVAERRNLEIELIRISEEQRRVIGCELHDGLGQHLISLSLLSASLQHQLTDRAQPEANAARRIGELIDEATSMTRSVARGLYPVALEHGGLLAALEQLANHARSLHKMDCVLGVGPEVQVHDPLVAINLYRIAQETITNALKYSQAGLMRIDLARVDGKVRLTLSDDGIGIDPSRLASAKGLGMHSMHYRASLLGGSMEIESNAQQGTIITVTYPDLEGQSEQRHRA